MSQTLTFSQRVNELFFGVDVSKKSASLLKSLLSIPQLQHDDNVARQWDLNVAMEMKSNKAWRSRHLFSFSESPLLDLTIEKGAIELTIGETKRNKKLLNLGWAIQFGDSVSANKYFDTLKQLFDELSTERKFEYDKNIGDIAQFSTRNPADRGVKDITLFLRKSPMTKKYQISLMFGTEFIDD
ncbi:hypothetical protein [Parasegetibacter sp. NRK P23]|uniref:hypothetical protein n=1 Tax=Parasegetibacter sp. NRK P23 TaxID=2942999 RepID=UPI0020431D92|nr:hypothetical protein [Parasegetibacter sp. NRK P23]MCM5530521.1 hypothetical protein [Parasegetibacter sp. NRK P23]